MATDKTITSNHPGFDFDISTTVHLDIDAIWPDGDGPTNPTADDVAALIKKCGGVHSVIRDWCLDDNFELTISGNGTIATVRR